MLKVNNLKIYYKTPLGFVKAVDGVSFEVKKGEIFGIAGESGCGKSTLVNSLVLRKPPMVHMGGEAILDGKNIMTLNEKEYRKIRYTKLSIIPQYSLNALNPTKRIKEIVRDLAKEHGYKDREEIENKLRERLKMVGLSEQVANMYPIELSGGMKQRAVMVVSTLLDPKLLIADEITSALDVTNQRIILELLYSFIKEEKIVDSIIFITHDMGLLDKIADRIMIMYAGKVVEIGPTEKIINEPAHPYTQMLLNSLPRLGISYREIKLQEIPGEPPALLKPPSGCRLHPRCPYAMQICKEEPDMIKIGRNHFVACHMYRG